MRKQDPEKELVVVVVVVLSAATELNEQPAVGIHSPCFFLSSGHRT